MSGLWLFLFLPAMVLHECAHAFVADRLGDPGPRAAGRLSLDPRRHLDLAGSVIMPVAAMLASGGNVFVGFAKPVEVNTAEFRNPPIGLALVAAAGPAANVLLGAATALAWKVIPGLGVLSKTLLWWSLINLLLAAFNLLPIPPLDGSRVFAALLPRRLYAPYLDAGLFAVPAAAAVWLGCLLLLRVDLLDVYVEHTVLGAFSALTGS